MPSRASARPPTIPVAGPTLGAAGSLLGGRSSAGEPHQGRAPLVAQGTSSACGIFTEIPSAGANGLQKEQWSIDCHAIDWLPVSKLLHCVSAHAVADFCHGADFQTGPPAVGAGDTGPADVRQQARPGQPPAHRADCAATSAGVCLPWRSCTCSDTRCTCTAHIIQLNCWLTIGVLPDRVLLRSMRPCESAQRRWMPSCCTCARWCVSHCCPSYAQDARQHVHDPNGSGPS